MYSLCIVWQFFPCSPPCQQTRSYPCEYKRLPSARGISGISPRHESNWIEELKVVERATSELSGEYLALIKCELQSFSKMMSYAFFPATMVGHKIRKSRTKTDWGWSDIACARCDGGKRFTKQRIPIGLWITFGPVSICKAQISRPTVRKAKIDGRSSVCSVKWRLLN